MKYNFDPKDVYGPQDAYEGSEALQYIGKRGYFGDSLVSLQENIVRHDSLSLTIVFADNDTFPYQYESNPGPSFALFLPADKVQKKEDKK